MPLSSRLPGHFERIIQPHHRLRPQIKIVCRVGLCQNAPCQRRLRVVRRELGKLSVAFSDGRASAAVVTGIASTTGATFSTTSSAVCAGGTTGAQAGFLGVPFDLVEQGREAVGEGRVPVAARLLRLGTLEQGFAAQFAQALDDLHRRLVDDQSHLRDVLGVKETEHDGLGSRLAPSSYRFIIEERSGRTATSNGGRRS